MRVVVTIYILCLSFLIQAQNLVENGSFEDFNTCPNDYSQLYYEPFVKLWTSPNAGTPDYFNACSQKCGVPLNWVGSAEAYHGNAYMGIIACMQQFDPHQIAYREYIRIKLTDTLQAGNKYYASMQIRLALSCNISCNGIGMYFSDMDLNSPRKINYPFEPQIVYSNNQIIDNKNNWVQLCGTFTANGDEIYLIIGNFLSNQKMQYKQLDENLIQTQSISPMAYYLIDDVKVFEYNDSLIVACGSAPEKKVKPFEGKLERDEKLILKNLHFETDKAIILENSYFELNKLVYALKKNTTLKIKINGHTDNTGGQQYNQELSEKRALSVRNYLLQKGISNLRMSVNGFGDTQPISDNNSVEGKQLNRRVEIEVY